MTKRITLLFGVCLLAICPVLSQNLNKLEARFSQHRLENLQEKIYVHTDREFYLCGDIIWFAIYNVDGVQHKPIDMSRVAYVEVIGKDNHPVMQAKVELKDGHGNGSLFIPSSLNSGHYLFRVYTRWMKNFSSEFYFQKSISIVNTFTQLAPDTSLHIQKPDVQFFPEGGQLVESLKSKVAFKAIDSRGRSLEHFVGMVYNEQGDTITQFKPYGLGMGHFYLTPQTGQTYQAQVRLENNQTYEYTLPQVSTKGHVMSVEEGDKLSINIETANVRDDDLYLLVHCRQQIVLIKKIELTDSGNAMVSVDKASLFAGIHHITLFDEDLKPLCERLYFNYDDEELLISPELDKKVYDSRSKVSMSLSVSDNKKQPLASTLSVSVFRLDSLSAPGNTNIRNYLMLTSDLTGRIEQPEFYFQPNLADRNIYLDNLMLTHGWRRFAWRELSESEKKAYVPEYMSSIVTAKVTVKSTGKPANGVHAYLSVPGKFANTSFARSDEEGMMTFEVDRYYGETPLHFKTSRGDDSLYHVELISPFTAEIPAYGLAPFTLSREVEEELRQRSIGMQTHNVYFEKQLNTVTPQSDTMSFYYNTDKTYYLDDYTRFTIMEDVMREYVPEILVRQRNKKFYFMVLDINSKTLSKENPMIFFDGVPVYDVDKIMKVDPLKIKKMEVVTKKYFLGRMTLQGILSYTTYKATIDGIEIDPSELFDYGGLQYTREFYQPKYEHEGVNDRLPDYRSLLYWKPDIHTDASGKTVVDFYTSDLEGTYQVVVEGLTNDGLMGSQSATFSVETKAE